MNDLREQARHHWQGILGNLGISGSLKTNTSPAHVAAEKTASALTTKTATEHSFATNAAQATASNSS